MKVEIILSVADGDWKVIERKPLTLDRVHYEGHDGKRAKDVFDQLRESRVADRIPRVRPGVATGTAAMIREVRK